jgi:2'-5' RNA ligase
MKSFMRLFTAIDIPEEILATLEKVVGQLRPTAPIAWSRTANLHVTVKFIGSWAEERLEELKAALASIRPPPPIAVQIRGLGFRRSVFLCGVVAPELARLAAATERATSRLGIERETRTYFPHLTLARIKKKPCDLRPLRAAAAAIDSGDFGTFEASRFFLYESRPQSGGSVYTKLAEFPLSH